MIRIHVLLDEETRSSLRMLARAQGRTISDLVREAIRKTFAMPSADERERTLQAIEGLWRDRTDIKHEAAYVRSFRRTTRTPVRRRN